MEQGEKEIGKWREGEKKEGVPVDFILMLPICPLAIIL